MRTPSQTVGPFFSFGLCVRPQNELPDGTVPLAGRVLDGDDVGVLDALVELWDPDVGFGRCGTDADGRFSFLLPASAQRLEVIVFARGLLKPVLTRVYVPDAAASAEDPTMVARAVDGGLVWDVHLQGERETAFFEL
jgi:protocatechuate 3,4-dioxygenase, alpha subunit